MVGIFKGDEGIHGPPIGFKFFKGMKEFTDRRLGPNFKGYEGIHGPPIWFKLLKRKGIYGPPIWLEFLKGMKGSTDRRFGPNIKKVMQGSTDYQIGPASMSSLKLWDSVFFEDLTTWWRSTAK